MLTSIRLPFSYTAGLQSHLQSKLRPSIAPVRHVKTATHIIKHLAGFHTNYM